MACSRMGVSYDMEDLVNVFTAYNLELFVQENSATLQEDEEGKNAGELRGRIGTKDLIETVCRLYDG
jgi:hypothetical protein